MSLFSKHHQQQQRNNNITCHVNSDHSVCVNNNNNSVLQKVLRYISPKHNPTNIKNYLCYVFSILSSNNNAKVDFLTFYNYSAL